LPGILSQLKFGGEDEILQKKVLNVLTRLLFGLTEENREQFRPN